MKSIKTMLLGIAALIIATCGALFWTAGSILGTIIFFVFLIIGIFLCADGFLTPHE